MKLSLSTLSFGKFSIFILGLLLFKTCIYIKVIVCVWVCVCVTEQLFLFDLKPLTVYLTFRPGKIECDAKMLYDKGKTD